MRHLGVVQKMAHALAHKTRRYAFEDVALGWWVRAYDEAAGERVRYIAADGEAHGDRAIALRALEHGKAIRP